MWLWLEPLDVLLFRDSRPFTGGETHRARSLFPPSPLTLQGALRTFLFAHHLKQRNLTFQDLADHLKGRRGSHSEDLSCLVEVLGDHQSFGRLRLRGPFLARLKNEGVELLFPAPFDLLKLTKNGATGLIPLQPLKEVVPVHWDGKWSQGLSPLWWGPVEGSAQVKAQELPPTWISVRLLSDYLAGKLQGEHVKDGVYPAEAVCSREQRAGIKLQPGTRTVETGMLYTVEFLRFHKDFGFVVQMEILGEEHSHWLAPLKEGVLSLGGEARGCCFRVLGEETVLPTRPELGNAYFKLYLATPAVFKNGWLPDFLDQQSLQGEVNGLELRLVAAAVGKPLPIGSWDLALNRPRKLYFAVPPGSVYFLKLEAGELSRVTEVFHGATALQSVATDGWLKELGKIGFGLTLVGAAEPREVR